MHTKRRRPLRFSGRSAYALLGAALLGSAVTSACTGTISDHPDAPAPSESSGTGPAPEEKFAPSAGGLRFLTSRQYKNSIRQIFGEAAAAVAAPPTDAQLHGFDAIGASDLARGPAAVNEYEASALAIAGAVVADKAKLAELLPCTPVSMVDGPCYAKAAARMGRLAWRRPLTHDEIANIVKAALVAGKEYKNSDAGLTSVVSALLQSPYFLFLVELGEPDEDDPSRRRLTQLELATRMSMFLLNTTPDEALLAKAEAGELKDADAIRGVARDLLRRPEAREAVDSFFSEIFRLREIAELPKDLKTFPAFTEELKAAMPEETLRLLRETIWNNADMRDILTSESTFVNRDLAKLYGLPPPDSGYVKMDLPEKHDRVGILGHASILAKYAHPGQTSPTRRGLFVQTVLLCTEIPPPPPGVAPDLPDLDPDKPVTMRERLEGHKTKAQCAACHALMDPIGLALEKFDTIGRFREKDNGLPILTADGIEGFGQFASARDLGAILRRDARVPACMVKNVFRNAIGHMETYDQEVDGRYVNERPALKDLEKAFTESGYRLQELLIELCASPAFTLVGLPK